jgi:hypothetical protein
LIIMNQLIIIFSKKTRIAQLFLGFFALAVISFAALAKPSTKELPFPAPGSSINTISFHIQGLFRDGDKIFQTLQRQNYFIVTPFLGIKGSPEESFGKPTDSSRIEIPPKLHVGNWQGGAVINNKILLLDGFGLRMAAFSLDKFVFLSERTFAWDIIKPARDRAGEPTARETADLRRDFARAFRRTENLRLSGIAAAPASWADKKHHAFVVASRIDGFPILKLICNAEDATNCVLERSCFAEGLSSIPGYAIHGVGVSEKRGVIVVGDKKNHRLLILKMNSCFDLPLIGELKLPSKLKELTSLHIDGDDRLWVSTNLPDDYNNSAVFTWAKEDW